jgi:type IV pilus assembly protein PilQ
LVSGGVAFFGGHLGHVQGNPPTTDPTLYGRPSVAWASLVHGDASSAYVQLNIPGFSGRPAIEVIPPTRRADRMVPDRLVIDLPGVNVGQGQTRAASKISHPFILAARLAQYASEPSPVTRLVLELAPGVQAEVSREPDGVGISLTQSSGKVRASLVENSGYQLERASHGQDLGALAKNWRTAEDAAEPLAYSDPVAESPATSAPPLNRDFESLPQIGAPYIGLPSLGSISAAPIVAANVFSPESSVAPLVPTAQTAKMMSNQERRYVGEPMDLNAQNADLMYILLAVASHSGLNLVIDPEVSTSKGWTYDFSNTPWDEILEHMVNNAGLAMEISNSVLRIARVEKIKKEADDRKAMEDAKVLSGDLVHVTRGLSYAKVDDVLKILDNVKSQRGKIIVDQRTSTLFLSDVPSYVQTMEKMIDRLDIRVPQVVIEARIVEANRGWEKAFGVSWPQSNTGNAQLNTAGGQAATWATSNGPSWNSINNAPSPSGNTQVAAFSPGKAGVTDLPAAAGEVWLSFLTNRMSLNMIIQALEKTNQIKVVSEPKLLGQNNASALISDGSRIPYTVIQGGIIGGAVSVQFTEAELKMEVTPQITNDGTIILDVHIEKGQPDFGRNINNVPTILRKQIKTQVLVKDGGTAILGGVFTNTVEGGTTGVPFLSRLPGIGWMFRNKTNNDNTTEMLVMISPKIIDS